MVDKGGRLLRSEKMAGQRKRANACPLPHACSSRTETAEAGVDLKKQNIAQARQVKKGGCLIRNNFTCAISGKALSF
ncbi:hypothetical protein V8Z74_16860 [Comamonas sp. w2-DMI]